MARQAALQAGDSERGLRAEDIIFARERGEKRSLDGTDTHLPRSPDGPWLHLAIAVQDQEGDPLADRPGGAGLGGEHATDLLEGRDLFRRGFGAEHRRVVAFVVVAREVVVSRELDCTPGEENHPREQAKEGCPVLREALHQPLLGEISGHRFAEQHPNAPRRAKEQAGQPKPRPAPC